MQKLKAIKGYEEALRAANWHTSPRYKRLEALEDVMEGHQYDGMPDWFDDSVPLFQRAPCLVYLAAQTANKAFVDMVLGESRYPSMNFEPEEDNLSAEDAEKLTGAILLLHKESRFRTVARFSLYAAMASGSTCVLVGAREGKLFTEMLQGKICTPELTPGGTVKRLVIEYPTLEEFKENGEWVVKAMLHKRVIDDQWDTSFVPVPAEYGKDPVWVVDKELTTQHGLGFCPAVWYPFMSHGRVGLGLDGIAIHDGLEDEIYALDMALSQRHRAALYAGDPIFSEHGVAPGFNPSEGVPPGAVFATAQGGALSATNPATARYVDKTRGVHGKRKKTPGGIWSYESNETRLELHILPEGSLESIQRNADDIQAKLGEMLSVVFIDPEKVKFASQITGKALETLRERQVNRADQIRDDISTGLLLPVTNMLIRLAGTLGKKVITSAKLAGVLPILARFGKKEGDTSEAETSVTVWSLPEPQLVWGPYFKEDFNEQAMISQQVRDDLAAGIITLESAIERIKPFYGIRNIEEYKKLLEISRADEQARAVEHAGALAKATAVEKPAPKPAPK